MRPGLVTGAVLALLAGPACAYVDIKGEYGANVVLSETTGIRAGGTRAGTVITSSASLPGPGGSTVTGRVAVSMTTRGIAVAAARLLPYVGAGMAAYELYRAFRTVPDGAGGTLFDPGLPQSYVGKWGCSAGPYFSGYVYGSGSAACQGVVEKYFKPVQTGYSTQCAGGGYHRSTTTYTMGGSSGVNKWSMITTIVYEAGPGCASVPGPVTMTAENALQAGQSTVLGCEHGEPYEFDGKCRSSENGDYTVPQSPDVFGDKVDKANKEGKMPPLVNMGDVLGEAYGNVGTGTMPAVKQPHVVVEPYPAEVPGGKVVTQNPDGTVTEVATGWNVRPAFQFPTNPGKSTWSKTTTTTQKDSNGNVTSTKTETQTPSVEAPAEDPCTANPERVGCLKVGEVEDTELGKKDVPVSVTPMAGWGGAAATCPQPTSVQISGFQVPLDNALICKWLDLSRPLLVAVAGIVAALIVIGGLKE